jgi:hypothetical protein
MGGKRPTNGLYLFCSKVTFVGIEGLKMLSNLGDLPVLLIILVTSLSLRKWLKDPKDGAVYHSGST